MKTLKKLLLLAILALAPTTMFAADHIVFIHGWQLTSGGKDRIDTWDRMTNYMANATYGVPFRSQDKMLVVNYYDRDEHGQKRGAEVPIDRVARNVHDQIQQGFPDGTSPAKMDFVVHSMGGLVLRSMIKQGLIDDTNIGRVVTLATPHYGTDWSDKRMQAREMQYGSEFIWDLANESKKISPVKVLCVAGTKDWIVLEWSAALNGCSDVRYVARDHSAMSYDVDSKSKNDAICYCQDGRNDAVYRLVTEFLSSGTVSAGSSQGNVNGGAILFQIVDGKNRPVTYDNQEIVQRVQNADGSYTDSKHKSKSPPASSSEEKEYASYASEKGIGAVMRWDMGNPSAIATGSYALEIRASKDNVFAEFTSELIPVQRGRTTVKTIYAESVRPLDYVFLIDTTGSMGSHINSVKSNAKNLIESQLLNGARNSRVAVVDYRDFPERTGSSSDYAYDVKCKFTSDAATAIAAINSLTLGDGGDGPETVYSGIHACIVGKGAKIGGWQENSVKTIMVMGDARPLDPEPITGYTKSDVVRWANELKTDEDDEVIDIEYRLKAANMKAAKAASVKVADVVAGASAGGISIYPVVTSSSLVSSFSEIAEETGGKVVSSSSYASVADAVKEVVEQSVAANGFEFGAVSVVETAGSVNVRVFGGSESDSASIGYQVVSGSGVNGTDFMAAEGVQRLTWAEGERSYKTITIPVIADASTSNDKVFSIVLCDPSGMGLGGINVCRINLLDKDNASGEYRMGDVYVQGVARNTEMGSVSGSGFCALGSTRTLTATPKSGFVFTSWENGSTASRRRITGAEATSNAVDGVATCVASFIPLADLPLPTIEASGVVTGIVKEAFCWNLDYYSISEVTATCSGLPPGLVFADGVVSGTPTSRGSWTATFTVKNAKGSTSASVKFAIVSASGVHMLGEDGTGGAFDATKATAYNGCIIDDSGNLVGFLTVKVNKVDRTGACKSTVTLQPVGGKKQTIKGTISVEDGTGQGALDGLTFTASGVTGTLNGYSVDGAIDASKSKDAATVAVLNGFKGKSYVMALEPESATGENSAMANGVVGLSVVFSMKGKAKVTGTMPDGTKVSVSSQLIVGSEWCCLPVVHSKTGSSLAFLLWFDREGNFDSVSGMTTWKGKGFEVKWSDEVAVSKVGNLSGTSYFNLEKMPSKLGGADIVKSLLPINVEVTPEGGKWKIAKSSPVKMKDGSLTYGANPSALKLTYKAKAGTFTGTVTFYTDAGGKLKKTTAKVNGIVVDGVGHGTATIKREAWPIIIGPDRASVHFETAGIVLPSNFVGEYSGFIEDSSKATGNPKWPMERGTLTMSIGADGETRVEIDSILGKATFAANGWDSYSSVVLVGTGGEQLTLSVGNNEWYFPELEGTVVGGIFGATQMTVYGARNRFTDSWSAEVKDGVKAFLAKLTGRYRISVEPINYGGGYPYNWNFGIAGEGEDAALTLTIEDDGTAKVSGTLNGRKIEGVTRILFWTAEDYARANFYLQLDATTECLLSFALYSCYEPWQNVGGEGWMRSIR